jgi:hypothetical protein
MKSKNGMIGWTLPVLLLTAAAPVHAGTPSAVSSVAALDENSHSLGLAGSTASFQNALSASFLSGSHFALSGNQASGDTLTTFKSLVGGGGSWAQAVSRTGTDLSFLNANWYSYGFIFSDSVFGDLPQPPLVAGTGCPVNSQNLLAGQNSDSSAAPSRVPSASGTLSFLDDLTDIGDTSANFPAGNDQGSSADPMASGHQTSTISLLNAALGATEMPAMHISGLTLAGNPLNLSAPKTDFMVHGAQSDTVVDPMTDNNPLTTVAKPNLDPILPEPSTMALGSLGAAGLLLFRRRLGSLD